MAEFCFDRCGLRSITFESGSRLAWIEKFAFEDCPITEICIPAMVELIGCVCVETLAFEQPSRLRDLLSLPMRLPTWVDIPDSVEKLGVPRLLVRGRWATYLSKSAMDKTRV
jgi:hypothetical protein